MDMLSKPPWGSYKTFSNKTSSFMQICKIAANVQVKKNLSKASDKEIGKYLYSEITTMSPTFVKLGQFMSSRSDIFGKDLTNELKLLQDNVKAIPQEDIINIIDAANLPLKKVDYNPIASASIGQVHYAELLTGEKVVIKIKRPMIDVTIIEDFQMLTFLLGTIKKFSSDRRVIEMNILVDEYYALLQEETDFKKEVSNIKLFGKMFKNISWIKVPKVYEQLCDDKIIVMDYLPSVKVDDVKTLDGMKFDREKISEKLSQCFLSQIVDHGYVHIDPHPGNVGVSTDGKIVFYDYGMVLKIDDILRTRFGDLLVAIYDQNSEDVCRLLVELKIVYVEEKNWTYFQRFVASLLSYIDNLDINEFKMSYIDKMDPSDIPFYVSSKFILLLRGLSILEGICKKLNPNFNYNKILGEFSDRFNMFDISFFEKRGTRDFEKFTSAPQKIMDTEITVSLLEKDIQKVKKQLGTFQLYKSINSVICLGVAVFDTEINMYVRVALLALSFVNIYK